MRLEKNSLGPEIIQRMTTNTLDNRQVFECQRF